LEQAAVESKSRRNSAHSGHQVYAEKATAAHHEDKNEIHV
jgi:hypothetical protein